MKDSLVCWRLRVLGYVVLDRSKWDSNLLTVNWSDPQVLHKFLVAMNLDVQGSADVVRKGSIPIEGACKSNKRGLMDRYWLSASSEPEMMDHRAKEMEKFSNSVADSDRIPRQPTARTPNRKNKNCGKSTFPLSSWYTHPDVNYAELGFPALKRKMALVMEFPGEEKRDSLALVNQGMVSKKLQVATWTVLHRGRWQSAPQERTTQELHMDR